MIVSALGTQGGIEYGMVRGRCVFKDPFGTPFSTVRTRESLRELMDPFAQAKDP